MANAVELTRGKTTVNNLKPVTKYQPILKESQMFVMSFSIKGELMYISSSVQQMLYKSSLKVVLKTLTSVDMVH